MPPWLIIQQIRPFAAALEAGEVADDVDDISDLLVSHSSVLDVATRLAYQKKDHCQQKGFFCIFRYT